MGLIVWSLSPRLEDEIEVFHRILEVIPHEDLMAEFEGPSSAPTRPIYWTNPVVPASADACPTIH
jgi:hypothetical protein